MDSTITNLRALIDSGKRENIEMAAQLSVNLPDEWQWLHRHCKAKLYLPDPFPSWYAVFAEYVKYDQDVVQVVQMPTFNISHTVQGSGKVNYGTISMYQIHQNVANEFHYLMLGAEAFHLSREIAIAEHNLNSQYLRIAQKDDGLLMSLSKKLLRLIQRQR